MDRPANKRFKKLKIKRNQTKATAGNNKIITESDEDEESFKLKRFMNDVKRFCMQPSVNSDKVHGNSQKVQGFKIHKDKIKETVDINKFKEKSEGLKFRKENIKDANHKKRDGLFQRGVVTKDFNKGLMPPSLSARVNEDLQKMIELACGKSSKHLNDKKSDKGSVKSPKLTRSEPFLKNIPAGNDAELNLCLVRAPDYNLVERENHEPLIDRNTSDRAKTDLYLQFTHFVTRSLFNAGINKLEVKAYSDSIKDSLVKSYRDRLSDVQCKNNMLHSPSDPRDDTSSILKTPNNEEFSFKDRDCPFTSKSEEGPAKTKFMLANDSQLSDDIIVRKPVKLYSSGLEYLKAVYSGVSENNINDSSTHEPEPIFSPMQHESTQSVLLHDSENSSHVVDDNSYKHSKPSRYSLDITSVEGQHKCDIPQYSVPLQYYPGRKDTSNGYIDRSMWNDGASSYQTNRADFSETGVCVEQLRQEESPKYISLLPPSRRGYDGLLSSVQSDSKSVKRFHCRKTLELLSLPAHPPPRKSPDIQYLPRRMF